MAFTARVPFPDSPWYDEQLLRRIARERGVCGRRATDRYLRRERARLARAYQRWIATGYLAPGVRGLGTVSVQGRRARGVFAGDWCYRHVGFRGLRTAITRIRTEDAYDGWRLRWVR